MDSPVRQRPKTGVQSVVRAFDLLERIAARGGRCTLSQLASESDLAMPTIHRFLQTLVDLGYLRQAMDRHYVLSAGLVRLGDAATHVLGVWVQSHLDDMVDELGESGSVALFDRDAAVYVAQSPGKHSMRMFTEVGHRAPLYSTGIGKAMLADLPADSLATLLTRIDFVVRTPATITTPEALVAELERIRDRGYATDQGEHEIGAASLAVAVPGVFGRAAISISAPEARMNFDAIEAAVPVLRKTAAILGAELAHDRIDRTRRR
jgi:IclR family acetate operon transcriptional repressor